MRRVSNEKSRNNIGDSFDLDRGTRDRKRSEAYGPNGRNRYDRITSINVENSMTNSKMRSDDPTTDNFCASVCSPSLDARVVAREKNETDKKGSEDNDNGRYLSFLKMITLDCDETHVRKRDDTIDAKMMLRLTGPSPRSCYVRRNVTGLVTYKHYRERECKIKTISNETKHIASVNRPAYSTFVFNGEKEKKHAGVVINIVTKDIRKMRLKESCHVLSFLEKYLDIKTN